MVMEIREVRYVFSQTVECGSRTYGTKWLARTTVYQHLLRLTAERRMALPLGLITCPCT